MTNITVSTGGTLTYRSHDGIVLTAPVECFEVSIEDGYSGTVIDVDYSPISFNSEPKVEFTAQLVTGQSYTIEDLAVDVEKRVVLQGNKLDEQKKFRQTLDIPDHAVVGYNKKKNATVFEWTERAVVDE